MKYLILPVLLILSLKVSSQITVDFEKYYGGTSDDYSVEVKQTIDGGYISVGQTTSNGYDFYVVKTDAVGDTSWTKTLGGTDEDWGYSVEQTTDTGYAVFGWTKSYGAGDFPDFYLIKLDVSGNTQWVKTPADGGVEYGYTIHQTSDGGYAMVGSQCVYGPCNFNGFFVKTDINGDTLWTKVYGGNQNESVQDFVQTSEGGYALGGYTESYGSGGKDFYFIRTDSIGDTLWTKTYGGANDDEIESIRQTADSGYIIFGRTKSFGAGSDDFYLIKTNPSGDTIWTKTYGGSGSEKGKTVQQTSDGGYILIGQTQTYATFLSAICLIKTNSSGDILWTKVFSGKEAAYGRYVEQTADGGFILSGSTLSMASFQNEVILIKLTDTSCTDTGSSFSITECGSYTWNSITYTSSGTYTDTIPNTVGCDSVMTLNLTINTVDTSVTTSANSLTANATVATYQWLDCNNNYATISGEINQTFTTTVTGNFAVAVEKSGCTDTSSCYNSTVTEIIESSKYNKFSVYTNPTNGLFIIERVKAGNKSFEITDITGKVVKKGNLTNKQTTIDLSKNDNGVYLLKVEGQTIQLVKQ
ncbi:MAG: hypothetical protein A3H98_06175 [Bacteroidetes bacterium RIFCSPLOWO2_02_FULL_36_8]|nr:MAG: hypothetical protein A3H98_06175 [Bacteroidetes bacterium RIFCSPLOWO2_02_FULL_36_8]OFY71272.1 MAG: hypothetical protein A3G23_02030 [Bacteroidetes bacterium RIFCSPLOWO2_12_FULL_37_12]